MTCFDDNATIRRRRDNVSRSHRKQTYTGGRGGISVENVVLIPNSRFIDKIDIYKRRRISPVKNAPTTHNRFEFPREFPNNRAYSYIRKVYRDSCTGDRLRESIIRTRLLSGRFILLPTATFVFNR